MMIFLLCFIIFLICLLALTAYKNLQLKEQIEEIYEQIDDCLDILEISYINIKHASDVPVMFDEPVVRRVLTSIKAAKNAVLIVANKITPTVLEGNEDDNDEK